MSEQREDEISNDASFPEDRNDTAVLSGKDEPQKPQRMLLLWYKKSHWIISILLALQHTIVLTILLHSSHSLLIQKLPPEKVDQIQNKSKHQFMATSFFASGIATILQTTLGSRLPLVQAASFEFLMPAVLLISNSYDSLLETDNGTSVMPQVHMSQINMTDGKWIQPIKEIYGEQQTHVHDKERKEFLQKINFPNIDKDSHGELTALTTVEEVLEAIKKLKPYKTPGPDAVFDAATYFFVFHVLTQVNGAILVGGILQIILGISGIYGIISQHCGPMVLAPLLTITGLSTYLTASYFSSANWGLSALIVLLIAFLSQYLQSCYVPVWRWRKSEGFTVSAYCPAFRIFSVLLPVLAIWSICVILEKNDVSVELLPEKMEPLWRNFSTFKKPWIKVPYPGEWGWPILNSRSLCVGIGMAVTATVNTLGCYMICARVLHSKPPPRSAYNRGICMEGLGSIISGILGSVYGTAASIPNACTHGLTQAGCRHAVQVTGVICILLGVSPRLTEFLSTLPISVHGGLLSILYSIAVATGISYFQYTDIDSGRNIFIVGFTTFMALLVPRWLNGNPGHLSTGWLGLDFLILSLLTTPMVLGGVLSFLLENTVPGTLEERGLLANISDFTSGTQAAHHSQSDSLYKLPPYLRKLCGCERVKTAPLCAHWLFVDYSSKEEIREEGLPEERTDLLLLSQPHSQDMKTVRINNNEQSVLSISDC
ncbi:solute carrier family 23 member 3 [Protopterus annectens]|uniref:solute carrier family 23 member 3 n=1 Tax=Protopterus annectens TaxID=7888 RepID=UPI001CF9B7B8|nr:solute carrier family 23 member 3 [Protopterus annectens]